MSAGQKMKWTNRRPKRPGWYWLKRDEKTEKPGVGVVLICRADQISSTARVFGEELETLRGLKPSVLVGQDYTYGIIEWLALGNREWEGEWAGPIEPPPEKLSRATTENRHNV